MNVIKDIVFVIMESVKELQTMYMQKRPYGIT